MAMVDPIGSKLNKVALAPVAPVKAAARVAPAADAKVEAGAASSMVATARDLASTPPVDSDRVARIRKAVADGSFPIVPTTIADRLLAFKLNWKPDEPA
ncbi:flagellar biosynthesis anti-sigma factor FlgM [Sphingomonas sp. IW22]|jgi:negative regulator of flagellin synthesis FlgM|uniref:flagellar biosynthesis anti-sigma factor FlgM n=1 Tax=Sphingomonas sp. IW22 TaxID=3242489 RepID=UPI0035202978